MTTIRRKMKRPEQQTQIAVVKFLTLALPEDAFFFAVPNGGYRTPAEAGILRAMGQKAGVCDLVIIWRGWALGVEMKSLKGKLTAIQQRVHEQLARAGMNIATCQSIDDVQRALDNFGIPVRARTFAWVARKIDERGKAEVSA